MIQEMFHQNIWLISSIIFAVVVISKILAKVTTFSL